MKGVEAAVGTRPESRTERRTDVHTDEGYFYRPLRLRRMTERTWKILIS